VVWAEAVDAPTAADTRAASKTERNMASSSDD
jgi:hypothetical protein